MPPPRCRVLLVEDDRDTSDVMIRLLQRIGCEVVAMASVGQALDHLVTSPVRPTHVFLDLMLPDASGVELLKAIRRDQLPVRVAVVTAAGPTSELVLAAERANPDAIFHKPLFFAELEAWVRAA